MLCQIREAEGSAQPPSALVALTSSAKPGASSGICTTSVHSIQAVCQVQAADRWVGRLLCPQCMPYSAFGPCSHSNVSGVEQDT